jgi:flagellar biosynthesis GTPase FlhF
MKGKKSAKAKSQAKRWRWAKEVARMIAPKYVKKDTFGVEIKYYFDNPASQKDIDDLFKGIQSSFEWTGQGSGPFGKGSKDVRTERDISYDTTNKKALFELIRRVSESENIFIGHILFTPKGGDIDEDMIFVWPKGEGVFDGYEEIYPLLQQEALKSESIPVKSKEELEEFAKRFEEEEARSDKKKKSAKRRKSSKRKTSKAKSRKSKKTSKRKSTSQRKKTSKRKPRRKSTKRKSTHKSKSKTKSRSRSRSTRRKSTKRKKTRSKRKSTRKSKTSRR